MANDDDLPLSELVAAFSYALDITEGQPEGHCIRSCWIGMHIGSALGLSEDVLWDVYFTLLLKDLGCSSNAARICALYLTDDLKFKHDFKWVDGSFPQVVKFALKNTALGAGLVKKIRTVLGTLSNTDAVAQELIETRCSRGADIAKRLGFGAGVAAGVYSLDEHWNGQGHPCQLAGEAIPLAARIALLAQVVEVFHRSSGVDAAIVEAVGRRGTWFDPRLVDALAAIGAEHPMWAMLGSADADLEQAVAGLAPPNAKVAVDEDYLDEIAAAFGEVVDSKSPYTSGHSTRVALYTDLVAKELGLDPERRRWLHRGALLHDVGKLGVSNAILDKPGKLDEAEWVVMRKHPVFTEAILSRIPHFKQLAVDAAAHHERLDGKGYPRGVGAAEISLETRIITTADIFDAITAERPYRGATAPQAALAIMAESVGTALDPGCFAALCRVVAALEEKESADAAVAAAA